MKKEAKKFAFLKTCTLIFQQCQKAANIFLLKFSAMLFCTKRVFVKLVPKRRYNALGGAI